MGAVSRRRFLYSSAVAAGGAAVLAACGSNSPGSKAASGGGGKKIGGLFTYNMWSYDNPPGVKQLQQIVSDYNRTASRKIKFNISTLAGSGATLYPSKIQSLIASGNTPDLFENWVGTLASPFVDEGAVQPLSSWYKKYQWAKIVQPSAVKYVTFKGEPYEVPMSLLTVPVWYSKALFKKAGVAAPPTTYAEWEAVNNKLVQAQVIPAAEAVIDGWDVMRLFEHLLEMTAGPSLHDQLLTLNASWNQPQVADAFDLLHEWGAKWLEKGFSGFNPDEAGLLFTSGKAAQSFQGPWELGNLQAANANLNDFGIFVPPVTGATKPRLAGFAQGYMIGSHLKGGALDALGDFFNWFLQPDKQRKYFYDAGTAVINGVPSGTPLALEAEQITASHETYLIQDEALGTALSNSYFSIQSSVLSGSMTGKAAAAKMQAAAVHVHS